jgi:hypothetical protein
LIDDFSIEFMPLPEQPYTAEHPPFVIEIPARKIKGWVEKDNSAGPLPVSPVPLELCDDEISTIALIPYGAAKLRITQFPYVLP